MFARVLKLWSSIRGNSSIFDQADRLYFVICRFICTSNPGAASQFESLLFPPFNQILQLDIAEFTPYVFQLFSQLLSFNTETELSPQYQSMIGPLVQPSVWQQQGNYPYLLFMWIDLTVVLTLWFLLLDDQIGNIPALVKLLQAYFVKGSNWIVANNQLEPILGIFQKLVSSKINDHHAFELLTTIIETVPMYRFDICICLEMGPFSMPTTKTCIFFGSK